MLKKILLGLALVIVALAVVVGLQPSDYSVTRSVTIAAQPAQVFSLVNDFHKWEAWSPWAKMDPAMRTTYGGAPSGAGASYSWTGNDQVGEGRMTITDSQPNERIVIRLEFIKPFASTSITEFTFKPEGTGTAVNWTMSGQNNFMAKAFCLAMGGMDKMIGPDFEKGLAQMKSLAETTALM